MAYERLDLKTGQVITEEVFAHLEDGIEGAANAVLMTPILYAGLVALRDAGKLKAGMFYRITDYVTTTIQENTQSAGHAFDVIVMATDSRTLSEEARAIVHEGDTYFTEAGANLAAWKVWYALDNDSTRFAWADAENGKGVIYRLIDEWNNDCPYDFKNIMFVRYELASPETVEDEPWLAQMSANIQAQFTSGQLAYIWSGVMSEDVYWEEEAGAVFSSPTGNTKAFFTFTSFINNEVFDKSLTPKCHDNTIGKLLRSVEELSNNVFFATTENSACRFNSFGNNCYFNSFGDGCYSISFGNNCSYNIFGDGCYSNSFGDDCRSNSFGNNCYFNNFGDDCHSNSFGDGCYCNSFGNNGYSNSFGNECRSNSFGNECYYNSFGNNCRSISFGDNCSYNSFGNGCQSCKCGNHWTNCRFGNGCRTVYTNSEAEPAHYVRNLEIAQGCENVRITIATTASSNSQLQNVHIATMSNTFISGLDREKRETAYVEVKNGCAAIGYLGSLDIFVLD